MAGVASQAGEASSPLGTVYHHWFPGVHECQKWYSIGLSTVTAHSLIGSFVLIEKDTPGSAYAHFFKDEEYELSSFVYNRQQIKCWAFT